MKKEDIETIDEVLDEAQLTADERKPEELPEAPAVANIRVWIKGYGVMLTVRGEKMGDIVKRTETLIDYAVSHGWASSWKTDEKPVTSQHSASETNQESCSHEEKKVGQVKKDGPNKGKFFKSCVACGKFLGWATVQ